MMRVWIIGLAGLLMMGLGGCASTPAQKGEALFMHGKGRELAIQHEAPQAGEYMLYAAADEKPQISVSLKKGDALGFKQGKKGKVIVVCGPLEQEFTDQDLVWRVKK